MLMLATGLALFLGIHLLPTVPPLRHTLVQRLGEQPYKGLFSLASLAGFVLILIGYTYSEDNEQLFSPFPAAIALAPFAMVVSFVLFAAANMRTHIRQTLRHPMLLGLLVWSLVHLLANGDKVGTILFGSFFAYAVIDLASAVARGATRPFVPDSKQDMIAIAAGTALAFVVMVFHGSLFGVPVVSFGR